VLVWGLSRSRGNLDFTALNGRQEMVVFVSWGLLLLVAMAGPRFQRLPADLRWFLIWLLSFSVVNCFICASLAMVDPRYQGRMVWLFPFAALMVIFVYLERYEIPERAKRWLKGKHLLQDSRKRGLSDLQVTYPLPSHSTAFPRWPMLRGTSLVGSRVRFGL
jgi:hypothetical protein